MSATSTVAVKLQHGNSIIKLRDDTSQHWKNGSRRLWVSAMFLGTVLLYSARSAIPLCIADMSKDLSWDKFDDGAIMSAFFWGYTPAQVAGGYLSDRYGGELVLGYAGIMWSLCTILAPLLPARPVLFFPPMVLMVLSRVLTGLSQGLHYPSLTNIIVRRIPLKERSFMTGSVFSAGPVGTLLMGSAGSFVLIYSGWRSVFLIQGAVGLFWAWIWKYYSLQIETKDDKSTKTMDNSEESATGRNLQMSVPYGLFFKNLGVWALIVCQFTQAGAFWNLFSWLPLYFEEVFPGSKKWVFNVMPWIVFFPCATVFGILADYMIKSGFSVTFVRKLFQTVSMCGCCLCMLLIDWAKTFNQAVFLLMLYMSLSALGNSGIITTPQDMAPQYAGSLFGVMNSAGAFSGVVMVPLSGYILGITRSWSSVFHVNALVLITGSFFFLIFGTAKKIV